MFSWLLKFAFFVYLLFSINIIVNSQNETSFNLNTINNDSVIEFFGNCLKGEQPGTCSKERYICCEENSISYPNATKDDVNEKLKSINVSCGLPKTFLNVRALTEDTELESAIDGEMPWMVEIFEKKGKKFKFICAGTLINPKVVLTAQHCVRSIREPSLRIVANSDSNFTDVGKSNTERNISKIIRHPDYYSGAIYNDIALIILEEPFDYSESVLFSICLPKQGQDFSGQRCLALGWGPNPQQQSIPLRKVDLPVLEDQQCESLLRKTRLGENFTLHSSFMCAGGEEGKDTCKGEGGGPLICLENYRYVQAGIVSWGVDPDTTCGKVDQPGIYTDVAQFTDWIVEEMKRQNVIP